MFMNEAAFKLPLRSFVWLCFTALPALFVFVAASCYAEPPLSRTIVVLGDSLTAGFGLDVEEAYPALLKPKLEVWAKARNVEPYKISNAGVSGDTTAGGLRRLDWALGDRPQILLIALGANDGLRGQPPEASRENLRNIIRQARAKLKGVKIILAGMLVPPNQGESYSNEYKKIFPEVAAQENVSLLPFLLEGVAGVPQLNQADGIHPTAEGQKIIAEHVWKALEPLL